MKKKDFFGPVLADEYEHVIFIVRSYEPAVLWQTCQLTYSMQNRVRVKTQSSCATQTKSLGFLAPVQFPPTEGAV